MSSDACLPMCACIHVIFKSGITEHTLKILRAARTWSVVQVVQHRPGKYESLSSNPITAKKETKIFFEKYCQSAPQKGC
jgi:hypothetical protein